MTELPASADTPSEQRDVVRDIASRLWSRVASKGDKVAELGDFVRQHRRVLVAVAGAAGLLLGLRGRQPAGAAMSQLRVLSASAATMVARYVVQETLRHVQRAA